MTTKKSEPYTITRYYREGNFWEWKAGVPFTETAREVHHQAVDGAVEIIFKRPRMRKAETYTVTDTSAITYAVVTQGDVVVYDSRTHVPVAETADMAQLPADVVETLMNATPEEARRSPRLHSSRSRS